MARANIYEKDLTALQRDLIVQVNPETNADGNEGPIWIAFSTFNDIYGEQYRDLSIPDLLRVAREKKVVYYQDDRLESDTMIRLIETTNKEIYFMWTECVRLEKSLASLDDDSVEPTEMTLGHIFRDPQIVKMFADPVDLLVKGKAKGVFRFPEALTSDECVDPIPAPPTGHAIFDFPKVKPKKTILKKNKGCQANLTRLHAMMQSILTKHRHAYPNHKANQTEEGMIRVLDGGMEAQDPVPIPRTFLSQIKSNLILFKIRMMKLLELEIPDPEIITLMQKMEIENDLCNTEEEQMQDAWDLRRPGTTSPMEMRMFRCDADTYFKAFYEELELRVMDKRMSEKQKSEDTRSLEKRHEEQMDTVLNKLLDMKEKQEQLQEHLRKIQIHNTTTEMSNVKEREHWKATLGSYYKDLMGTKEQLYRSYKDKKFIDDPIDLMPHYVDTYSPSKKTEPDSVSKTESHEDANGEDLDPNVTHLNPPETQSSTETQKQVIASYEGLLTKYRKEIHEKMVMIVRMGKIKDQNEAKLINTEGELSVLQCRYEEVRQRAQEKEDQNLILHQALFQAKQKLSNQPVTVEPKAEPKPDPEPTFDPDDDIAIDEDMGPPDPPEVVEERKREENDQRIALWERMKHEDHKETIAINLHPRATQTDFPDPKPVAPPPVVEQVVEKVEEKKKPPLKTGGKRLSKSQESDKQDTARRKSSVGKKMETVPVIDPGLVEENEKLLARIAELEEALKEKDRAIIGYTTDITAFKTLAGDRGSIIAQMKQDMEAEQEEIKLKLKSMEDAAMRIEEKNVEIKKAQEALQKAEAEIEEMRLADERRVAAEFLDKEKILEEQRQASAQVPSSPKAMTDVKMHLEMEIRQQMEMEMNQKLAQATEHLRAKFGAGSSGSKAMRHENNVLRMMLEDAEGQARARARDDTSWKGMYDDLCGTHESLLGEYEILRKEYGTILQQFLAFHKAGVMDINKSFITRTDLEEKLKEHEASQTLNPNEFMHGVKYLLGVMKFSGTGKGKTSYEVTHPGSPQGPPDFPDPMRPGLVVPNPVSMAGSLGMLATSSKPARSVVGDDAMDKVMGFKSPFANEHNGPGGGTVVKLANKVTSIFFLFFNLLHSHLHKIVLLETNFDNTFPRPSKRYPGERTTEVKEYAKTRWRQMTSLALSKMALFGEVEKLTVALTSLMRDAKRDMANSKDTTDQELKNHQKVLITMLEQIAGVLDESFENQDREGMPSDKSIQGLTMEFEALLGMKLHQVAEVSEWAPVSKPSKLKSQKPAPLGTTPKDPHVRTFKKQQTKAEALSPQLQSLSTPKHSELPKVTGFMEPELLYQRPSQTSRKKPPDKGKVSKPSSVASISGGSVASEPLIQHKRPVVVVSTPTRVDPPSHASGEELDVASIIPTFGNHTFEDPMDGFQLESKPVQLGNVRGPRGTSGGRSTREPSASTTRMGSGGRSTGHSGEDTRTDNMKGPSGPASRAGSAKNRPQTGPASRAGSAQSRPKSVTTAHKAKIQRLIHIAMEFEKLRETAHQKSLKANALLKKLADEAAIKQAEADEAQEAYVMAVASASQQHTLAHQARAQTLEVMSKLVSVEFDFQEALKVDDVATERCVRQQAAVDIILKQLEDAKEELEAKVVEREEHQKELNLEQVELDKVKVVAEEVSSKAVRASIEASRAALAGKACAKEFEANPSPETEAEHLEAQQAIKDSLVAKEALEVKLEESEKWVAKAEEVYQKIADKVESAAKGVVAVRATIRALEQKLATEQKVLQEAEEEQQQSRAKLDVAQKAYDEMKMLEATSNQDEKVAKETAEHLGSLVGHLMTKSELVVSLAQEAAIEEARAARSNAVLEYETLVATTKMRSAQLDAANAAAARTHEMEEALAKQTAAVEETAMQGAAMRKAMVTLGSANDEAQREMASQTVQELRTAYAKAKAHKEEVVQTVKFLKLQEDKEKAKAADMAKRLEHAKQAETVARAGIDVAIRREAHAVAVHQKTKSQMQARQIEEQGIAIIKEVDAKLESTRAQREASWRAWSEAQLRLDLAQLQYDEAVQRHEILKELYIEAKVNADLSKNLHSSSQSRRLTNLIIQLTSGWEDRKEQVTPMVEEAALQFEPLKAGIAEGELTEKGARETRDVEFVKSAELSATATKAAADTLEAQNRIPNAKEQLEKSEKKMQEATETFARIENENQPQINEPIIPQAADRESTPAELFELRRAEYAKAMQDEINAAEAAYASEALLRLWRDKENFVMDDIKAKKKQITTNTTMKAILHLRMSNSIKKAQEVDLQHMKAVKSAKTKMEMAEQALKDLAEASSPRQSLSTDDSTTPVETDLCIPGSKRRTKQAADLRLAALRAMAAAERLEKESEQCRALVKHTSAEQAMATRTIVMSSLALHAQQAKLKLLTKTGTKKREEVNRLAKAHANAQDNVATTRRAAEVAELVAKEAEQDGDPWDGSVVNYSFSNYSFSAADGLPGLRPSTEDSNAATVVSSSIGHPDSRMQTPFDWRAMTASSRGLDSRAGLNSGGLDDNPGRERLDSIGGPSSRPFTPVVDMYDGDEDGKHSPWPTGSDSGDPWTLTQPTPLSRPATSGQVEGQRLGRIGSSHDPFVNPIQRPWTQNDSRPWASMDEQRATLHVREVSNFSNVREIEADVKRMGRALPRVAKSVQKEAEPVPSWVGLQNYLERKIAKDHAPQIAKPSRLEAGKLPQIGR